MRLGYNTNGLACHRWPEVLELLAEVGYRAVAITVDHHCLDPWSPDLGRQIARTRQDLERLDFTCVIETGARFLLNPRVKHEPTLLSPTANERSVRLDFLKRCVDIAADLNAQAVSFWSGVLREPLSTPDAMRRLADGCGKLIEYAGRKGVQLAFEPEPGMFVETLAQYDELLGRVDAPHFGLTMDVGHVHCVEEGPIAGHLRRWADRLFNVHIEDMCRGVHEHLRFGEGEIDFVPVLSTLKEIGYAGGVHVELSRHSHTAPDVMRESFEFLQSILAQRDGP